MEYTCNVGNRNGLVTVYYTVYSDNHNLWSDCETVNVIVKRLVVHFLGY